MFKQLEVIIVLIVNFCPKDLVLIKPERNATDKIRGNRIWRNSNIMVKTAAIFILHLSLFCLFCSERRTQTPSILSAITGSGYFSCIDPEASGYAQPEQIVEFWESFGVSHGDIITVLEESDEILTYLQSNLPSNLLW